MAGGNSYDSAITVFSPDGHLFQVEYALEAVRKGSNAVAVRGQNCIVLGAEKKAIAKWQEPRTVRKITKLDNHIAVTFAGLTADGRVLINKARVECQTHRLNIEDSPSVEYISRFIAGVQQKYTQSGGVRPFGVSTLIAGFDDEKVPKLFQTEPSGAYSEWQANSIGPAAKKIREYFEKTYTDAIHSQPDDHTKDHANGIDQLTTDDYNSIKLSIKGLLEVVQPSSQHIEIALLKHNKELRILDNDEVDIFIQEISSEKDAMN